MSAETYRFQRRELRRAVPDRTPLDLKNVFTRPIDPILNACAECGETKKKHPLAEDGYRRRDDMVEWHGLHAFRRGLGSNLNDLGVLDLTIQKILRHNPQRELSKLLWSCNRQAIVRSNHESRWLHSGCEQYRVAK
jgi:hypothetical protein